MRNYLFSIGTHVIILLLLLGLSFTTISKKEDREIQHAIMVDFSDEENEQQPQIKSASAAKARKVKSAESPQKKPVTEQTKTVEKRTLRTSQKPKTTRSTVLEEESKIVEKVVPHNDHKPSKEEVEAERREKEKAEKRSKFASLLSKAKDKSATGRDQPETEKEATGAASTGASSSIHNKNIRGVLGNRKVLKSPVIKDQSQKKGRVVVKICVGADGKVLSSRYTMMGSTTSDTYLINLAEKGARQYLFSPSSNPKECGNVVIDFQLK